MEVKRVYKQSEVGLIPDDWDSAALGNHATFKTGPFGSLLHRSDYVDSGVPIVNPMQIIDGTLVPTQSMTISEAAARRLSMFRLSSGDVVIGRRGDMGRCAYVRPENDGWLCGTGSMIICCRASLNSRYLQRVLSSPPIIAAIENASVGTTMINLNNSTLRKLQIPLPPTLEEQEAIAGALSDADAWIESLEQLIAKKRKIKQGALQELLTGKRRLPGFSGEWEQILLGEVADVKTGPFGSALHESDYKATGTPIITVEHLGEFGVEHFNLPLVSERDYYRLRAYTLELGDIVFSRVGSVDRNALIRSEEVGWLFSGRLLRVRLKCKRVSSPFLSYQFHGESFISLVRNVAVGQTMACLNTQILKGILIRLPSIEEQTSIATVLSDLDTEIGALESKLAKAREIKQGMMQELLTGRIRLIAMKEGMHNV